MKKLTEGILAVRDFSKDKTWLIDMKTNEELEIDEGLDMYHEEFVKMKEENISPNLYCIIEERNGKKTFREAHVTNIDDIEDVRETLNSLMPGGRTKKTGRNEPCPCGSGRKYKKCCIDTGNTDLTAKVLQLKIILKGIKPPVWRRFLVSDSITFEQLHEIIQSIMGWENCHMYQFNVDGTPIESENNGIFPDSVWTSFKAETSHRLMDKIKVREFLSNERQKFYYLYDFGDNWHHVIKVEKVLEKHDYGQLPVCIEGKRSCPPEDSGGIYGYNELLEIRKNRSHPQYRELIEEWLGEDFDPENFDKEEVNEDLREFQNTW